MAKHPHNPMITARVALFVDYENLHQHLSDRKQSGKFADETIIELIDELRRYFSSNLSAQTVSVRAYADFGTVGGNSPVIQKNLVQAGIEPVFTPSAFQKTAAEMQLAIDTTEFMLTREDVEHIVLVTGNRAYLPLLSLINREGKQSLLVAAHPPETTTRLPFITEDNVMSAFTLLSRNRPEAEPEPVVDRSKVKRSAIQDRYGIQTIEVIESYFGQYEEVYLTPLLRKLSELIDDPDFDPKETVNDLEACGAVWMERRRGFPYDYTVLLLDEEHEEVAEARARVAERTAAGKADVPSTDEDEEDYDDDGDFDDDDSYIADEEYDDIEDR